MESRSSPAAEPLVGGSLALLTIPFVFTQDNLLTTREFIDRAKERGYELSLDLLQTLHNHRLLVPLYRVSDTPVEGRHIDVKANGGPNARGWTLLAAAEGRLRDPAEEGYSAAWPYSLPKDEDPRKWWNGFIYSSWQLLDVGDALIRQRQIVI